jgi:anti-sigma regulatory factor (Ser/Thr protein kinase)
MQIVREMKCGARKEFEIELAHQAAVPNAIVHGCGNDLSRNVELSVACDEPRSLLIVVRDPGPVFDLASAPNPTIGESVFFEHGRGIFFGQPVDGRGSLRAW